MFLAVRRLRLLAQERPALRGGAAARARLDRKPRDGPDGGANDHAEARNRPGHRRRDDGPRVGRHQGAQQAAAADGGCGPSTPPSCGRSATGSSIPRGRRCPATPGASGATASALRSTTRSRRRKEPGRVSATSSPARRSSRSRATLTCCGSPGRRSGGLSDQLRALPRPRCPGLRRLSQPQRRRMAVGRQDRGHPKTISFGIRSGQKDARTSQMPRFGLDKLLEPARSTTLPSTSCRSPASRPIRPRLAGARKIFVEQCVACHGAGRQGHAGAGRAQPHRRPSGSTAAAREAIVESIRTGRGGMMPAWAGRLDPVTLKVLAVYVHSLGGGK